MCKMDPYHNGLETGSLEGYEAKSGLQCGSSNFLERTTVQESQHAVLYVESVKDIMTSHTDPHNNVSTQKFPPYNRRDQWPEGDHSINPESYATNNNEKDLEEQHYPRLIDMGEPLENIIQHNVLQQQPPIERNIGTNHLNQNSCPIEQNSIAPQPHTSLSYIAHNTSYPAAIERQALTIQDNSLYREAYNISNPIQGRDFSANNITNHSVSGAMHRETLEHNGPTSQLQQEKSDYYHQYNNNIASSTYNNELSNKANMKQHIPINQQTLVPSVPFDVPTNSPVTFQPLIPNNALDKKQIFIHVSDSAPTPNSPNVIQNTKEMGTQSKHVCHICFKRFQRPSSLQTHYYTHTGEKIFECPHPECGKKFSVKSNMTRHYKLHRKGLKRLTKVSKN